jgi:hypothetical protein
MENLSSMRSGLADQVRQTAQSPSAKHRSGDVLPGRGAPLALLVVTLVLSITTLGCSAPRSIVQQDKAVCDSVNLKVARNPQAMWQPVIQGVLERRLAAVAALHRLSTIEAVLASDEHQARSSDLRKIFGQMLEHLDKIRLDLRSGDLDLGAEHRDAGFLGGDEQALGDFCVHVSTASS